MKNHIPVSLLILFAAACGTPDIRNAGYDFLKMTKRFIRIRCNRRYRSHAKPGSVVRGRIRTKTVTFWNTYCPRE